ncbi:hypothetical protein [Anaerostipes hadrus]|uniref:hypothetical protein n=1 Tax=Anaerostipes hadrus TaxID=649756 RepID=UPI0013966E40|nr:hypothetical protein [Anaerostipes hadrus]
MGTRAGAVGISFLLKKVKEVEKMGIKNLTEAEEKEFYRLVEKMNGKETGCKGKETRVLGYGLLH